MKTVWTDRSRVETFQRCARLRFLSYHEGGLGLSPAKESLPLAVGKSVHKGLETLLRDTSAYVATAPSFPAKPCWPSAFTMGTIEDAAVAAALADFAPHRHGIALDLAEESARTATMDLKDAGLGAQLVATAADLGMDPADPALASLLERQRNAGAEFDDWLWQEQAALVEGLVRAYAKRRLRPLLEEFEVLEVEREGDWLLASLVGDDGYWRCDHCGIAFHSPNLDTSDLLCGKCKKGTLSSGSELRFMSRPDALLRSRADNSLYLLSYKTAAAWDVRKARDAEHDMQGLSEGVEVEKRLARWWGALQPLKREHEHATLLGHLMQEIAGIQGQEGGMPSEAMLLFLFHLSAPPRILGIRYEYLLKGARYADKDLSARFGLNVWAQRSHLIRAYHAIAAPKDWTGQWCYSYDFIKDDGSASKLYYKTWRPTAVWEHMSVKAWIDMLDTATMAMSAYDSTVGMEPREMGWKSDAQAQGYTTQHPLDEVFPAPLTVYRQDDQLRDFVEQIEAQETRVAEAVAQVEGAADDGEKRHLLNVLFPMHRRSCSYPSECAMTRVCYGGEDAQRDPMATGAYKQREPHHTPEAEAQKAVEK